MPPCLICALVFDGAYEARWQILLRLPPKGCGTGGENLHTRKPSLLHRFRKGVGDPADMKGGPAGYIDGPGCSRQRAEVERLFEVAEGGRGGFRPERGGRGHLAAGHSIIEVVHTDDGQVHVSPSRVDKVIAADGEEIAVA